MSVALITGISGQDGSFLAEFLLAKGYEVHGLVRRSSTVGWQRLEALNEQGHGRLHLHYGDLSDPLGLVRLLSALQPTEVYNLAAQSHVAVSFELPDFTGDVTGVGVMRLLEALRVSGVPARFYQASSSEMFGSAPPPQTELTRVPSPLAVRRGEGLRLLGDGQLPRELRDVRLQRDPVQPRERATWRELRDPQGHPGGRRDRCRPAGQARPRQPRGQARTGASPATTSRRCG